MDQIEFTKRFASKINLDEKKAEEFVQAFSSTLADCFKKGEKVIIAEFGSFYIKDDKTVQFNPSAKLKEVID
jgi:nucleoid DNA-binding protein